MIKDLVSSLIPTPQANGASAQKPTKEGVFGALMQSLHASKAAPEESELTVVGEAEMENEASELAPQNENETVANTRNFDAKASDKDENEEVVDRANVKEVEPTFAPLVQTQKQTLPASFLDVQAAEAAVAEQTTEVEKLDSTVKQETQHTASKAAITGEDRGLTVGNKVATMAAKVAEQPHVEPQKETVPTPEIVTQAEGMGNKERLIEVFSEDAPTPDLVEKGAVLTQAFEKKPQYRVDVKAEPRPQTNKEVPVQTLGERVAENEVKAALTTENKVVGTPAIDREDAPTLAVQVELATLGTTTEVKEAYEPILPLKKNVQEIPVEEQVAKEFQKRERSVFNLRRSELVLGASSVVSANSGETKVDLKNIDAMVKPMIASAQAGEAEQSEQATREQDAALLNGKEFEKRPELMHLIQHVKAGEQRVKAGKETTFTSTSGRSKLRSDFATDTQRMALNVTRREGTDFLVQTSTDQEYFHLDPSLTLSQNQEEMLQEYMTEATEGKDDKKMEHSLLGYVRLSELPIANVDARRALVTTLGRAIEQEAVQLKESSSTSWQKHSFELEDGNTIDLTTRNVDGVLQIKLAATNPELTKLLQDAASDIREHLENELEMQFDLQFENKQQQSADFMGGSNSGNKQSNAPHTPHQPNAEEVHIINQTNTTAVRNFGYNQMEWTA